MSFKPMIDRDVLHTKIAETTNMIGETDPQYRDFRDSTEGNNLLNWWYVTYPMLLWGSNNHWTHEDDSQKINLTLDAHAPDMTSWEGKWHTFDNVHNHKLGTWYNHHLDERGKQSVYTEYLEYDDYHRRNGCGEVLTEVMRIFYHTMYTPQIRAWCAIGYNIAYNIDRLSDPGALQATKLLQLLENLDRLESNEPAFELLYSLLGPKYQLNESEPVEVLNAIAASIE